MVNAINKYFINVNPVVDIFVSKIPKYQATFSSPDTSNTHCSLKVHQQKRHLTVFLFVDPSGLEPLTSSLQMRRSTR